MEKELININELEICKNCHNYRRYKYDDEYEGYCIELTEDIDPNAEMPCFEK